VIERAWFNFPPEDESLEAVDCIGADKNKRLFNGLLSTTTWVNQSQPEPER